MAVSHFLMGGDAFMITWQELLTFCLVIIGVISLFNNRKD